MKEELPKKVKQDEDSEILDKIRKNDRHLRDINERILTLVEEINEQLGNELFEDLGLDVLVNELSKTSRERNKKAIEKTVFRNELLEKAVREHSDDILVDVIKAHENFDSMELLDLFMLAYKVNEQLGYDLFQDIYSYSLKQDFERVAIAVKVYKEEGKIVRFMK